MGREAVSKLLKSIMIIVNQYCQEITVRSDNKKNRRKTCIMDIAFRFPIYF